MLSGRHMTATRDLSSMTQAYLQQQLPWPALYWPHRLPALMTFINIKPPTIAECSPANLAVSQTLHA